MVTKGAASCWRSNRGGCRRPRRRSLRLGHDVAQIAGTQHRVVGVLAYGLSQRDDRGQTVSPGAQQRHHRRDHGAVPRDDPQQAAHRITDLFEGVGQRPAEGDHGIELVVVVAAGVADVEQLTPLYPGVGGSAGQLRGVEVELHRRQVGHHDPAVQRGELEREPARPRADLEHT